MSRRLNEIKTSINSQIQNALTAATTDTVLPSIQNRTDMQGEQILPQWTENPAGYMWALGQPISPWRTEGPVGYNGTPKQKMPRKRGKPAPENALCRKIVDKFSSEFRRLLYKRPKSRHGVRSQPYPTYGSSFSHWTSHAIPRIPATFKFQQ